MINIIRENNINSMNKIGEKFCLIKKTEKIKNFLNKENKKIK